MSKRSNNRKLHVNIAPQDAASTSQEGSASPPLSGKWLPLDELIEPALEATKDSSPSDPDGTHAPGSESTGDHQIQ
ncbi:MAG: hypothetical protein ACK449_10500 [Planctomycetota bacterium]